MDRAKAEARADEWIQARTHFGYSKKEVADLVLSVQEERDAEVKRVVLEMKAFWGSHPHKAAIATCNEILRRLGLEG